MNINDIRYSEMDKKIAKEGEQGQAEYLTDAKRK